uniref:Cupin type-1 domain-containing protein n=1 Tax=Fagus sylvatica TaxID=28930 RepID=A0A2N9JA37_FAGSY
MGRLLRYFPVCLIIPILVLCLRTQARPLSPNMEGNKKNQSLYVSAFVKVVPRQPLPPHVHGEVVPLNKGIVPPSAPSSCTIDGIGKNDEKSGGKCSVGA